MGILKKRKRSGLRFRFLGKTLQSELQEHGPLDDIEDRLLGKYNGHCALCGRPLGGEIGLRTVQCDHIVPRSHGGASSFENLYVAHRFCNNLRKDLEFDDARKVIPFRLFCEETLRDGGRPTFDLFLKRYLKQRPPAATSIALGSRRATIKQSPTQAVPVYSDPATGIPFFFAQIPWQLIENDRKSQPRYLEWDHILSLFMNFHSMPVHEPSNARLVRSGRGYRFLQFDGQHKTTAQILLGRSSVPLKVYVMPPERLISELVIDIQQVIRKRPLSTSATLGKSRTIVRDRIASFVREQGRRKSERDFFDSLGESAGDRRRAWREYLMYRAGEILLDSRMPLNPYLKLIRLDKNKVTTDSRLLKLVIRPLLAETPLDAKGFSDNYAPRTLEKRSVLQLLLGLEKRFLRDKWDPRSASRGSVEMEKAAVFFLGGSMQCWVSPIIELLENRDKRKMATHVSKDTWFRLERGIRKLYDLDTWTRNPHADLVDAKLIAEAYAEFSANRPSKVPEKIRKRIWACFF